MTNNTRKHALLRLIAFALEAGGVTGHEQADFALEHGEPRDFFVRGLNEVTLDRLAELYDVAAARVGWKSFAGVLRSYHDSVRAGHSDAVEIVEDPAIMSGDPTIRGYAGTGGNCARVCPRRPYR